MTVRLFWIAADYWPLIDAYYHASPVPLLRMPHSRFLNMVYSWAITHIVESDKFHEWHDEMNDLLPWQDVTSEAAVNLESDSFFAMQAKGGR